MLLVCNCRQGRLTGWSQAPPPTTIPRILDVRINISSFFCCLYVTADRGGEQADYVPSLPRRYLTLIIVFVINACFLCWNFGFLNIKVCVYHSLKYVQWKKWTSLSRWRAPGRKTFRLTNNYRKTDSTTACMQMQAGAVKRLTLCLRSQAARSTTTLRTQRGRW
jgi:hypothetical protein